MVQIFTKQKYVRRNWSGVIFGGGVYDCGGGVGGGGSRWAYILDKESFSVFVDLI